MTRPRHKTKMRYFLLALSLMPLFLYSQARLCIKKSYAYYSITGKNQSPKGGIEETIPTDKGNIDSLPNATIEKDTSLLVFIEASSQNIKWGIAEQGGHFFSITPLLQQSPLQPGILNGAGPITISASKGYYLYALQFVKKNKQTGKPRWMTNAPLYLKGVCSGKKFVFKISSLKKIIPVPPA